MNKRLQILLEAMDCEGIDVVFLTDEKNMHYYTGFYQGEGYAVISKNSCVIVTDSRYTEYASKVCRGFEVVNIASARPSDFAGDGAVCGFEDMSISYRQYAAFAKEIKNLKPVGDMTDRPRQIKDAGEVKLISAAAAIADRAFEHICSYIAPGITEKQIAAELDSYMKKNGADSIAFSTIAASGIRASMPHAIPTDEKVQKGDFIVLDYGCTLGGYCSDMTRTVAVGEPSQEKREIYAAVLTAQLKALACLRAGVTGAQADKAARDYLESIYPGAFGHGLGHSVGLYIHEAPNLSPRSTGIIEEGTVITVEPGVYLPGNTGVRIEDLVVVTKDGCDILSKAPKELIVI